MKLQESHLFVHKFVENWNVFQLILSWQVSHETIRTDENLWQKFVRN